MGVYMYRWGKLKRLKNTLKLTLQGGKKPYLSNVITIEKPAIMAAAIC